MLAAQVRETEHPTEWNACKLLPSLTSCDANALCKWNPSKGLCDVEQLAKLEEFNFALPPLTHYAVTHLLFNMAVAFLLVIWSVWYHMLGLWSVLSQFGAIVLGGVAVVGQAMALHSGEYGRYKLLRGGAGIFLATAYIVLARPRRVSIKLMTRIMLLSCSYSAWATVGILFVKNILTPLQVRMNADNVSGMQRNITELAFATFFFSFWVPVGGALVGRYVMHMYIAGMELCDGIISPQKKFDFERYLRSLINIVLDLYRFAYGRGVLMDVSPVTFG
eukprot:g8017.t1